MNFLYNYILHIINKINNKKSFTVDCRVYCPWNLAVKLSKCIVSTLK